MAIIQTANENANMRTEKTESELEGLRNSVKQMNDNLNAALAENEQLKKELDWHRSELDRVSNTANEYAKKITVYREALISLCKEINI